MLKLKLLLTFAFCFSDCFSIPTLNPSETYTHKLIVDDDQPELFELLWKIINDEVIFEVHAKTTGWVGIGISSNGGMTG